MNKKWSIAIIFLLMIFLTVDVILLTIQNRNLKSQLDAITARPEQLKAGERVESFNVKTLDGSITQIDYADSTTKYLFFILSTSCPFCEKNLAAWKNVVAMNQKNIYKIIGISIDDLEKTKNYIATKDVSFYLTSIADTSFLRKYKISSVPETILINGNGIVEKVWAGKLSEKQSNEIHSLISAKMALANQQIN